jgi:hypothetical protein
VKVRDKLEAAWQSGDTMLCVGLDPDLSLMPEGYGAADVARFNIAIIEATSSSVPISPTSPSTRRLGRSAATRPCEKRWLPSHRT